MFDQCYQREDAYDRKLSQLNFLKNLSAIVEMTKSNKKHMSQEYST